MPFDPAETIRAFQETAARVPNVLFAISLLAGPTILWILYRFVVQPRWSRYAGGHGDVLWMCTRCRSANEARSMRCYRCDLRREEIVGDMQVFDEGGLVTLPAVDPTMAGPSVTASIDVAARAAGAAGSAAVEGTTGVGATGVAGVADQPGLAGATGLAAVGAVSASALLDADTAADAPLELEPDLAPAPVGPEVTPPRRLVAVGPGRPRGKSRQPVAVMADPGEIPADAADAASPGVDVPTGAPVAPSSGTTAPGNRFRRRYAAIQAGKTPIDDLEERVKA